MIRTQWNTHIKGQAMVETALVLFILVLFVFGITEFGRAMYTKNTLNNAARAGARVAAVTPGTVYIPGGTTLDCSSASSACTTGSDTNGCIYQAICNSLVTGIDKSQINVTISKVSGPGGATAVAGDAVSVTVTYGTAGNPNTGFRSVVPGLVLIGNVLTGQTVMRHE